MLEINNPYNFNCLFHNDRRPSASIYIHQSGHYLYKCHSASCGKCYNILNIVEKLGGFKSRQKAHKFIREIFNIEFEETEFQKEQKALLMDNVLFLTNGEYREQCPTSYKNTSWNIEYLIKLHELAMNNVKNENLTDEEGSVAFFASTAYLCKELQLSPNSLTKISNKNALLAYHKLLNKLDENEIPEKMNERRKAISANNGNKNIKNINVFSIPSYTTDKIEEIEQQGIKWKENKYTMKGISREMFFRSEGKEVANWLYPQYKKVTENGQVVDRTTSVTSDERTHNIIKVMFHYIENKGYVTEKDVVYGLSNLYRYITTEEQIKKSLKEILDLYGLQRVRANKELKNSSI